MPDATGSSAPRTRVVFIAALIALIALLIAFDEVAGLLNPSAVGIYGWNVAPNGTTIISVTPGYPAWQAGVRVGDTVDFATLPLLGRIDLFIPQSVSGGASLTFQYRHDGVRRTATMKALPTTGFVPTEVVECLSGLLVVAIGLWLVLRRPSRMTWGLLIVGLGELSGSIAYPFGSLDLFFVTASLSVFSYGLVWMGLMMFASRFPSDEPRGWLRLLDRAAIPAAVVFAAIAGYLAVDILVGSSPPTYAALVVIDYLYPLCIGALALAALFYSSIAARGSDRQRLLPVLVTFGVWTVLYAGSDVLLVLFTTPLTIQIEPLVASIIFVLFFFAVADGIIRHRVIDVSFVISRTLVYTILTGIVVGCFALVDFFAGRLLAQSKLALVVETAAAVLIGVSLNAMHGRVDHLVDSLLFRRRHLAEKRLSRVARTLPHATSNDFVDEALVLEPERTLELASSALFRKCPDGSFERRNAIGWASTDVASLAAGDPLVTQLRAELEALDLSDVRWERGDIPKGLKHPLYAVPVVVRHDIVAFALYGGHLGGEALDPDEKRSLRDIAGPAGAAYDHLEAESLRDQLSALTAAYAELRQEHKVVVSVLDVLRHQTQIGTRPADDSSARPEPSSPSSISSPSSM